MCLNIIVGFISENITGGGGGGGGGIEQGVAVCHLGRSGFEISRGEGGGGAKHFQGGRMPTLKETLLLYMYIPGCTFEVASRVLGYLKLVKALYILLWRHPRG